ncbi:MAG: FAD-dependent oxidoreductase [Pseudomonadales bacterium]|nr:FAD-dependent oxidoreductase [Pseudomonadales bacterium]
MTHLVLLGGGHSHVGVLHALASRTRPQSLHITLINEAPASPYSGMLPGVIAGQYAIEEMFIQLSPLAARANVEFRQARVSQLDPQQRLLTLDNDEQPLAFDLLSINTGSTPDLSAIPGAAQHATAVKPIAPMLQRLDAELNDRAGNIVVVGGGAAGVEMALALQTRLQGQNRKITLLSSADRLLPGLPASAAQTALQELLARGVQVRLNERVTKLEQDRLDCSSGLHINSSLVIVATGASAPDWVRTSGLKLSDRGFILVTSTLQSSSHPWVFAAGDIADIEHHPRPKSGVYAVRQAPILAHNLLAASAGSSMQDYYPQEHGLVLINTANGKAIASKNTWSAKGRWAWWLKDWIDTRFMKTYR